MPCSHASTCSLDHESSVRLFLGSSQLNFKARGGVESRPYTLVTCVPIFLCILAHRTLQCERGIKASSLSSVKDIGYYVPEEDTEVVGCPARSSTLAVGTGVCVWVRARETYALDREIARDEAHRCLVGRRGRGGSFGCVRRLFCLRRTWFLVSKKVVV